MRKVLLGTVLVALCISVANANSAEDNQSICNFVGDFSKSVMSARQNGVPAQKIMSSLAEDDGAVYADTLKRIVVAAYRVPLFHTERRKEEAITEFQNVWYLSCLEPQD